MLCRMARQSFPKLGQSMRFYVENTIRTRLRSPGLERYRPEGNRRARWLLVLFALAAAAVATGMLLYE